MHLLVYLCRSKNYGGVLKWTNMRYGKSSDTSPPHPPFPKKENAHYNMEKSAPYHQGAYLLTRTNSDNAQIHKALFKKGLPSVTGGLVVVGASRELQR